MFFSHRRNIESMQVLSVTWEVQMTRDGGRIVVQELTDSGKNALAQGRRERFDRNSAWLQAHIKEVYWRYRGKCVVIAGEEPFAADTPAR